MTVPGRGRRRGRQRPPDRSARPLHDPYGDRPTDRHERYDDPTDRHERYDRRTDPYDDYDRRDPPTRRHDRYDDRHDRYDPPTRRYEDERYDHPAAGPRQPAKLTVTRVAANRTRYLVGAGVRRVGAASRADGAKESGLTSLIWTHTVHYAADAMVTVALAGTVFFSAARSQQRLNVALYLLVTMAPFAIVAPFIGPALDRMNRGRRLALAGTAILRAGLAYIMAANFTNPLFLYPAAFGILVFSKAYGVLRSACVPRVLPTSVSLVAANARLNIFGLAGAAVAGGLLAGFIRVSHSYGWALRITAVVFLVAAVKSVRLPSMVDSSEGEEPAVLSAGTGKRVRLFGGQPLGRHVVTALRATAALRGLSGFLTLFLAFLIQTTEHGASAAVALGGLALAAGGGSFVGTALGARLKLSHPDPILIGAIGAVAAISAVAALSYSLSTAILVALVAGVANSFGKLCLDAIIQREVPDALTASAFARSETLLQLAWVFGSGLGIGLPSNGRIGFTVVAALLIIAFIGTVFGTALARRFRHRGAAPAG